ncbi:hypothetical protein BJ912DRAFT_995304 [Pholiota molesta]|nr:hypothetical protein BJ912DRAFT_995304 [Pholiota molesta]
MPAVSQDEQRPQVPANAFRVLVTGFGPFSQYLVNPSWRAVEPLQNTILHTEIHAKSASLPTTSATPSVSINSHPRPIHITTLQVPVAYDDVIAIVPGLHARPPTLPADAPPECAPPPLINYDFVFHLGVAGRGPLRMERQGHKLGYHMRDSKAITAGPSSAENIERERLGMDMVEVGGDTLARPTRGFGASYENFPDEIPTDIDKSGVEQIYTSMDAGHYICDFIYYCSLAEVRRSTKPYEKRRHTQVLFLHCPPVGKPLSSEEVTDAIKRIVVWVCSEQQLDDAKEEAAVQAGAVSA